MIFPNDLQISQLGKGENFSSHFQGVTNTAVTIGVDNTVQSDALRPSGNLRYPDKEILDSGRTMGDY